MLSQSLVRTPGDPGQGALRLRLSREPGSSDLRWWLMAGRGAGDAELDFWSRARSSTSSCLASRWCFVDQSPSKAHSPLSSGVCRQGPHQERPPQQLAAAVPECNSVTGKRIDACRLLTFSKTPFTDLPCSLHTPPPGAPCLFLGTPQ